MSRKEDRDRSYNVVRRDKRDPHEGWELLAKRCLLIVFFGCAAVIIFGSCLNSTGLKYSRVSTNDRGLSGCRREVMILNIENSNFCCEGLRSSDWVCVAAYDEANKRMTSFPWAYLLPLLPWTLTMLLMETSASASYEAARKRFYFYIAVLSFRTLILYMAFNYMQRVYADAGRDERGEWGRGTCWYSVYRRDGECIDHFDFSDHIVFYMVQIAIPAAVEIGYALGFHLPVRRWKSWLLMLPTILTSLALLFIALRAMMFTSIYFHTPKENLVALAIALLFAFLPAYVVLRRKSLSIRDAG